MNTVKHMVPRVNELKEKKEELKGLINKGDYALAKQKLEDYKSEFHYDIDIYSMEAIIFISEGNLFEAKNKLKEGLKRKPFNFDLNFNLAYVYQLQNCILTSLDYYLAAVRCANNLEEVDTIINALSEMTYSTNVFNFPKKEYDLFKNKLDKVTNYKNKYDNRNFPITEDNELLISRPIFENEKGDAYYSNYYRSEDFLDYPVQLWYAFKNEILYGKIVNESAELDIEEDCVIPMSVKSLDTKLNIKVNDEEYEIEELKPNRFNYLSINKNSRVSVNSNKPFILGEALNRNDKNKIKLILPIFIDGLSQSVIEGENLKRLMPNTYEFFRSGTRFTNFYVNGEWTLPSVANIFTGRYTTSHKLFNPRLNYDIGRGYSLISEQFKKGDYFTFQVCGDWRKSPAYGYARGFNRTIYQSAGYDKMNCEEVIFEAIEQLRAFEDRSHFMWLSIFELHNGTDNIYFKISSQISNSLFSKTNLNSSKKSVDRSFDLRRIEKYENEIMRTDYYLGLLYKFINEKYSNDEILVMMFSDHGQGYLDKKEFLLKESRIKVPFMIKGKGVPSGYCDEIMEAIDIYPTLLKLCDIDYYEELDGRLPKYFGGESQKEFAYTESIFPEKPYIAAINDKEHTFIFESKDIADKDGRFNISNYSIKLINKETGVNEIDRYNNKVAKYLYVVFNHIKEYIKI